MKRIAITELLDTDAGTAGEVSSSLGDLQRINRWFGGVDTTEDMVERVARETRQSSLSLLEDCCNVACICNSRCLIASPHI